MGLFFYALIMLSAIYIAASHSACSVVFLLLAVLLIIFSFFQFLGLQSGKKGYAKRFDRLGNKFVSG